MCPICLGGEGFGHSFHHHIAAFLIGGTDHLDMLVNEAALGNLISYNLIECCSVQIGGLLGHDQLAGYLRRCDDPGQPNSRRKQF